MTPNRIASKLLGRFATRSPPQLHNMSPPIPQHSSAQQALSPKPHDGLPRYEQGDFNPNASRQSVHSNASLTNLSQTTPTGMKGPDMLDSLRALPEIRQIPWKAGMELPPEKSTEHSRSQTRGAFLLVTRGKVRNPPCTRCVSGSGRFTVCVSLEGWFKGACATCEMATVNLPLLKPFSKVHSNLHIERQPLQSQERTRRYVITMLNMQPFVEPFSHISRNQEAPSCRYRKASESRSSRITH